SASTRWRAKPRHPTRAGKQACKSLYSGLNWRVSGEPEAPFLCRSGSTDGLRDVSLPHGAVVCEMDTDRIELVEPRDPVGIWRVRLAGEGELVRILVPRVVR